MRWGGTTKGEGLGRDTEDVISPDIQKELDVSPPIAVLSPRQKEILDGIVRGLTNKDIAALLGIRKDGIEKHVKILLARIGAANRTEAVAIAMRKQLLKI